jgi:hypothetical protein
MLLLLVIVLIILVGGGWGVYGYRNDWGGPHYISLSGLLLFILALYLLFGDGRPLRP